MTLITATLMPFTTNTLWAVEKDKFLAETWGCDEGHELMPHEAKGSCALCWIHDGRITPTFERGF